MKRFLLAVPAAALLLGVAVPVALAHTSHVSGTSVTVTAGKPSEFAFVLSTKSVKHGAITFKVTNGSSSGLAHDFFVCSSPATSTATASLPNSCKGKGTTQLGKGASATLSVTIAKAGNYEYLCTVPGHAAGGMKGILKVT
jgi:uncharacterized cupredoxin-like copper-binding protein